MKQLITRVQEPLAQAVKEHAALAGMSVNAYITELLVAAVEGRASWKRDAIAAGRLVSRSSPSTSSRAATVTTPPGYASTLVSSERDER